MIGQIKMDNFGSLEAWLWRKLQITILANETVDVKDQKDTFDNQGRNKNQI